MSVDYSRNTDGVLYPIGNMGSGPNYPPDKYTGNIVGSQFDAFKEFFGPSVIGAMMPQAKTSAYHATVFTVQNQNLIIDLPDVSVAVFMVAETLLASLMSVVAMYTVPIDTKSVITKEVSFDVGRFVPVAPLVHGPVSGAEAKEQTFDLHRYALGAQIEWILMLTSAGKTIWKKFMAAIINALRFTWADLIFAAFFAYAARPSLGPRSLPGRLWTDVAQMWSSASLCGTKTPTGMVQLATLIANERHARGLANNFTHLLVSEEWVRRASATLRSSATINGMSMGANPSPVNGNIAALRNMFGLDIIVIGDTVKDGIPARPLRQRIMTIEHHYVEWRNAMESRLQELDDDDAREEMTAQIGITLCDRQNSTEVFVSLQELYTNIAINTVNAADDADLKNGGNGTRTWQQRSAACDLVIFAPFVYQGDGVLAVSGKALTLATTELVTGDATTNVFSKMLNWQSVIFAAAFASNPNAIMNAGVSFPSHRILGGSTKFITRADVDIVNGDLSQLSATAGILVIAVPPHTKEQRTTAAKYGTVFGSISSELTRDEDAQSFGTQATSDALKLIFTRVVSDTDPEVFDPSNASESKIPLVTYEGISRMSLRERVGVVTTEWNHRKGSSFHGQLFYEGCELDRFQENRPYMETSTLTLRKD